METARFNYLFGLIFGFSLMIFSVAIMSVTLIYQINDITLPTNVENLVMLSIILCGFGFLSAIVSGGGLDKLERGDL